MAESNVPPWTRETSWRQGHVLPNEATSALNLLHRESPHETCVVVVSHDCDIAQDDLGIEPGIEVIVGRCIEKIDHNFSSTKNPRVLHLEMKRGGAIIAVALDATKKQTLQKCQLAEWAPDSSYELSVSDLSSLKRWLGVRYNRAAFPNEFERRLTGLGLRQKIEKALKPANEIISSIYFDLTPLVELSATDYAVYELTIVLLFKAGANPEKTAARAEKVADQIVSDFETRCYDEGTNSWQHVRLKDCMAISEEDAPVAKFKDLQQWRLDHWSFKPGANAALPPDLDT
jgi:hypothetical protein